MKCIFTICSNNYLAQAKTLGDSVLKYNKDYKFIIVLCDKLSNNIDYNYYKNFDIIEAHNLDIQDFDYMINNYNIVELNTSIKPFSFDYIYKNYQADIVMYFDPDTCLFNTVNTIEKELMENNIVLTPHICSPIPDDKQTPYENLFTNFGIYNLGFLGTKKSDETQKLIEWWEKKLAKDCKIDLANGIFVDQLPMNYAPLFFEKVKIEKNLGLNAAPWNAHERIVRFINGKYYINDENTPLIFYHFSNYNPLKPEQFSKFYSRADQNKDSTIIEFYDTYRNKLFENNWQGLSLIECFYKKDKNKKKDKENLFQKITLGFGRKTNF